MIDDNAGTLLICKKLKGVGLNIAEAKRTGRMKITIF